MTDPTSMFVTERSAFRDRDDAADLLVSALSEFAGQGTLLLAIPRGAVPMGLRIARSLGSEFGLVWVRKLGAPANPEFAIGAVDEDGALTMSPGLDALQDAQWIQAELARQKAVLSARRDRVGRLPRPLDIAGRKVIVVDDGLATGATMVCALDWVRRRGPALLIAAVPVASAEALDWVRAHADRIICPWRPAFFGAVSAFYRDFPQVEDETMRRLLASEPASAQCR